MPTLHKRWRTLWNEVGGNASGADICFDDLIRRYRERWRTYHTRHHIEAMLIEFDAFRESDEFRLIDPKVVEMAVWYHDAIYYPEMRNNEERSAELFRMVGECTYLAEPFVRKVMLAILATKHSEASDDPDVRTLCDLDLAILGQPKKLFDQYEPQIWEEYAHVPEDRFRAGRIAILRGFEKQQNIYSTDFFRKKYDAQAQENIERSIRQLLGC